MDFQLIKDTNLPSPAFVLDASAIIKSMEVLNILRNRCACKVLYSIKALPFSAVLETTKPFIDGFSVSSLFEARLANEVLADQGSIHLTTPGIRNDEWPEIGRLMTHISFNSITQYARFSEAAQVKASFGLRVNPKLSFLHDDRFDPCCRHSKLGVDIDDLWQSPCFDRIKGLHFHNAFGSKDFTPLINNINKIRSYFGKSLAKLDWLNLGGGYLFDQIDDHSPFIDQVNRLKHDYDVEVYIEPGNGIVGHAGHLVATVLDSFVSDGKTVAVLDTSVNHLPEVFEYQMQPELHEHDIKGRYSAILAGCTCLAGDLFGEYGFSKPLVVGDKVVFKNIGAYSLIKANRFNGVNLPDIYMYRDQQMNKLKEYSYQDYRRQWLAE